MSILRSPLLAAHESERLIEHRLQHAFQAETRSTHPPHMHITTTKAIASAVIAISAISAAAVSTPLRSKEGRSTDQIINPKQTRASQAAPPCSHTHGPAQPSASSKPPLHRHSRAAPRHPLTPTQANPPRQPNLPANYSHDRNPTIYMSPSSPADPSRPRSPCRTR